MLITLRPPAAFAAALEDPPLPPHPIELLTPAIDAATELPQRICPYCGHGIYSSPRAATAHCHGCRRLVPVAATDFHGEVLGAETRTAGIIRIHADARVSGTLFASNIIVEGRFLGTLAAWRHCSIRSTGKVAGTIICRNLVMEDGAQLEADIQSLA